MHQQHYRVLLADDHPLIRMAIRSMISEDARFHVIAEAEHGEEALQLIKKDKPDIAILDIYMPLKSGLEVATYVREHLRNVKLIVVTSVIDQYLIEQLQQLHVNGIVHKGEQVSDVLECLDRIVKGEKYISEVFQQLASHQVDSPELTKASPSNPLLEKLSKTEKKVLRLVGKGRTNGEIANELHNSEKTIKTHRYNICKKLSISGSNALLTFALQHKHELT